MTILAIVPTQREFEALVGVFSETGVETLERTIGRVSALECYGGSILVSQGGLGKAQTSLAPETVALLQVVQGTQQLSKIDAGPLWQETGYVFTQANGSPILPGSLTAEFASLVKELELPHLTFHGLRHAFATLCLVAGINPKVVSEALGHSSVTITLDLYSHVLPNMQDELAAAIANLLKR